MRNGRTGQAAVLLKSGKVLMVGGGKQTPFFGGSQSGPATISPEVYDPATDTWSTVASQALDRQLSPTATLLPDGRVLLVGGQLGSQPVEQSEVYDPASNSWTPVPADPRFTARQFHTATLLPDGRVLVAGGQNANSPTAAASLYNPVTNSWQIGPNMNEARCGQGAALLTDGKVLVAGSGCDFHAYSAGVDEFDLASNRWTRVVSLNAPLGGIAVALGGGGALFIGATVVRYQGDVEMFGPA